MGKSGERVGNWWNECVKRIKEGGGWLMRDEFAERWRQTVTDFWRTVNGGEKDRTGERYVITLNKGL